MNYRHAFHAGNFADVHKHVVLTRILLHLTAKESAFRVIDTHAGAGLYDLRSEEAERTGEWRGGIGRLVAADLPARARDLVAPYLSIAAKYAGAGEPAAYPGSPLIALALMRAQDRLTASEPEPVAAQALARRFAREKRASAVAIDGWTALNAYIPPKEKRGVVLIDPPFERPDEFTQLAERLTAAHRKWPTGVYLAWYPIKDRRGPDVLARALAEAAIRRILRSELMLARPAGDGPLAASGLIVVNPPFRLDEDLGAIMPALAAALGRERPGEARLDWVAPPA